MKDKAGKDIKPGDLIIYGKAFGRSAGLQYGKVLYVFKGKATYYYEPKKVEKLQFIGVDDGWLYGKVSQQKPSTLQFSDRILVVTRKQVDPKILKSLDSIKLSDFPIPDKYKEE